jgi:putative aldouronate transport system permease protein
MRTFFQSTVPVELIEAAAIDGSGEYSTLFKIIVPISKPGISTVALLTALAYWNEWFIAMLYVRDAKYIPLQYLLMQMQNSVDYLVRNSSSIGAEAVKIMNELPQESLRMALVVLIVVPIAFAYPFFQRYIISGLTIGSVKG